MKKKNKRIPIQTLEGIVSSILGACGLNLNDSRIAARAIVHSDARGFKTHGIKNLFRIYVPQLLNQTICPTTRLRLVRNAAGTALIDAQGAMGFISGTRAMRLAMRKAATMGIGMVVVKNSTHFGGASYYTLMAAKKGFAAIALSNLGSQVIAPAPGGARPLVGTNPFSIAIPKGEHPSFCLDMSTTVVSTGQIKRAYERGEKIPEGWLRTFDGQWTTDPGTYLRSEADLAVLGGARETGGFKGFGLALMVDILSGLLSGGVVGPRPEVTSSEETPRTPPGNDICHAFIAIDVSRLRPLNEFQKCADEMLAAICDSPSRSGEPLAYPGFMEGKHEEDCQIHGIEVEPDLWLQFKEWIHKLGLQCFEELRVSNVLTATESEGGAHV